MDRSKQTKQVGRPPNRQVSLNSSLAQLMRSASEQPQQAIETGEQTGHYKVVQIFDDKWRRKMQGPANHTAWQGYLTLSALKDWAEQLVEYPTVAVHIQNLDDVTQPTLCYNPDDGWIERPQRRGWF